MTPSSDQALRDVLRELQELVDKTGNDKFCRSSDAVVRCSSALDQATGKDIWYLPSPKVGCSWTNGAPCFNAQSAAPFAIPGVIFAGTPDGHERAYVAADGRIVGAFDTARGAIEVSSGSLASGMLYLISGYRGILGGGSDNMLLAFPLTAAKQSFRREGRALHL